MTRLWLALLGSCLAVAMVPAPVDAQARTCRQVLPSDFRRIIDAGGQEIVYFRDPVRFLCTGNVLLEADSAVVNRAASTVELIGHVVYRDSTRELRSEWANYLGGMNQLLARGSTVLRDLQDGAVVRGDQLNYLRQTSERPSARMIVTGDRPHATIPPRARDGVAAPPSDPPGPDAPSGPDAPGETGAPTEVRADRLELEGEEIFRAEGNVELERGDMTGSGRSAVFDQGAERMTLTGSAAVQNPTYRLEGDSIQALLEGNSLREVRSQGSARVISEELNVRSQRVRLGFAEGELERLEAWNPDPTAGPRARADARDFRLRADSIDAQADSIGMRELRAVGRAYGERDLTADTGAPPPALPPAIARDWIQGDTILAFFGRETVPPERAAAAADTAPEPEAADVAPERDQAAGGGAAGERPGAGEIGEVGLAPGDSSRVVLERIVVVGGAGPALSLYRMAAEDEARRPALNFTRASRIILFLERGEVARVEAEGPIEGLYLDPTGSEAGGREAGPGGAAVGKGDR